MTILSSADKDLLSLKLYDISVSQLFSALQLGDTVYFYLSVLDRVLGIHTRRNQASRFERLAEFDLIIL